MLCAFGRDDKSILEEQFHCGCIPKTPTSTLQAVMA
jgi:hypothetical protein